MTRPVIRVVNLSKSYTISHNKRERYVSLRDSLTESVRSLTRGFRGRTPATPRERNETFFALSDVSFELKSGERLGVIGSNGAGKSTLLKLLSRVTDPTRGRIEIRGRVASLLEVGTGFHPELTGRENIFLNGAVLGMRRAEIQRKFESIVSFAEVDRFLDTPVKRYSSGMYVRLAFSIAAHLEPDVLIVDEVLAVGDARFQKKCIGKIEDAGKDGRTVLFVSHNMGLVSSLCTRAILLESGRIAVTGSPSDVVLKYLSGGFSSSAVADFQGDGRRAGDEYVQLLRAYVRDQDGLYRSEFAMDSPIVLGMRFRVVSPRSFDSYPPYPFCYLYAPDGACAFYTSLPNSDCRTLEPGEYVAECMLPGNLLNNGTYFVGYGVSDCDRGLSVHFFEQNATCFNVVEDIDMELDISRNGYAGIIPGVLRPKLRWQLCKAVD